MDPETTAYTISELATEQEDSDKESCNSSGSSTSSILRSVPGLFSTNVNTSTETTDVELRKNSDQNDLINVIRDIMDNVIRDTLNIHNYTNAQIFNALKQYIDERHDKISSTSISDKDTMEKSHVKTDRDVIQYEKANNDLSEESVDRNSKDAQVRESSVEKNVINYINNLMVYINKADCPDMVKNRFNKLAKHIEESVTFKRVFYDTSHNLLDAVKSRPDLVEMVFDIMIIECSTDKEAIFLIGNNREFVKSILNHLKSVNNLVLLSLLGFLKIAVRTIQNDGKSCWLGHLKSCEFFGHYIIAIFKFQLNEDVKIAAIDLLNKIAKTNLPGQPNLLEELFDIYNLIPVLTTFCKPTIKLIEDNKLNLQYAYNWLSLMTTIKAHLVFHKDKDVGRSIFLRILFDILRSYQNPKVLPPFRRTDVTKQDCKVICKCASLLSYIHDKFSIPLTMEHDILMKLMLGIKRDIEREKMNSDSVALLRKLLNHLEKVWVNIAEHSNNLSIAEKIILFCRTDRQYFVKLGESHIRMQNRMNTISVLMRKCEW